ncbi:MAG: AAA family ATPase [Anaerovoracaceae bacterium]|jgi:exonuclease SbcC
MKPTKLILSAFGPYADRTEIHMDSLGRSGLYLITGNTGAGKTTIFDAISFALFGKASGDNREGSMLRSKYARAGTPTFVELEFEYGEKTYTIRRNPEYERPKSRGEGFTKEAAGGELIFPDGQPPLTKVREMDQAIVDLLGVDRGQFAQIAMIAQGDFLKLLLAKTDERREIFRKIFKTKPFEEFQKRMGEKANQLDQDYEKLQSSLDQYLETIQWGQDAPPEDGPIEERISHIRRLIEADRVALEEGKFQLEDVGEKLNALHQKFGELERVKETEKKLAEEVTRLVGLEESLKEAEATLREAEKEKPEIEKLAAAITLAGSKLDKYEELDRAKEELVGLQKSCQDLTRETKELEEVTAKMKAELEKDGEELGALSQVPEAKARIEASLTGLEMRRDALDRLSVGFSDQKKKESELAHAQKAYEDAKIAYEGEKKVVGDLERAFLDAQAGLLAETLIDGKACPVCGSPDHPAPAIKPDTAPSEEELDGRKKDLESLWDAAGQRSREAGRLGGQVKQAKEALLEEGEKLLGASQDPLAALPVALDKVKREIEEAKKALEDVVAKLANKSALEKELPILKRKLEEKTDLTAEKKEALIQTKSRMEAAEKRAAEMKKDLPHPGKKEAEDEIRALEGKRRNAEERIRASEEAHGRRQKAVNDSKATITTLRDQLKDRQKMDEEALLWEKKRLTEEKTGLEERRSILDKRHSGNHRTLDAMEEKRREMATLTEERKWVKALSDTVNAKVSGKEKIMLETYVQMTYFDRILARANVRFMKMSDGQYELVRRKTAGNFRSQTGLELDVIDHYNGTERRVASLSGGESFMASLSLALGLSEEIQLSAGGIRLDTMFVDEGFGSLDESSLGLAMKALQDLSEGNKLVGIISHVGELKELIDKQIVVTKEKSGGSRAEIIF